MKLPISVIILTYNEEKKIEACLKSVSDFVQDIFVVDSFSIDKTVEIVRQYTEKIYEHKFENYGKQRNWALKNLPINTEWILNLDADHRVTENLKQELIEVFSNNEQIKYYGFLIPRKTIFMGKWIKHGGHYPVYHAVLFKLGYGECEKARYNQHFVIRGKTIKLKGGIEDVVTNDLSTFVLRHNQWAKMDAIDQLSGKDQVSSKRGVVQKELFGNPIERRRYFRAAYMKLPLLFKPFIYFIYCYFIRLGFLDGKEGLIFHVLHKLWYQFLVDAMIYENKK